TAHVARRPGLGVLGRLREAVDRLGQSVVMVTHDPGAAAHADLVLFLADGRIVDEMQRPTAEAVLERMKRFDVIRAKADGAGLPPGATPGAAADEGTAAAPAERAGHGED